MSNISVDSVLQHKEVKDSFDKDFVSSFVGKIPEIMNLDDSELTLGHIASLTDQPRSAIGRFLQAASNMKNFPIGIVNRTPIIKKVSNKSAAKKTAKPEATKTVKTIDSNQAQQFNMSDVANAIIEALRKEPVGSSDKRYASVETLADELDVPEKFVADVIDSLRKRDIISLYEGENDFDEIVFFLNPDGFAQATAKAKASASKKAQAMKKEVKAPATPADKVEAKKEKPKAIPKASPTDAAKSDAEIDWLGMDVPKKTMNAVIEAMTDDKFTRNGILKEVAKKGVHQRNHVDAAFRQLVDNGKAVPTNDGGSRNYFTIYSEQHEAKAETATITSSQEKETFSASEQIETATPTVDSLDQSIMNSLSALLNSASESLKGGINTNEDVDALLAKVKSAEHMLLAAKALK